KTKGLGLGFGGNYASAYDVVNSLSMGTSELPAYFLLNANIFYDYQAKYRFGVKADNITAQKYWIGWGSAIPQKLRSFSASVTYKFYRMAKKNRITKTIGKLHLYLGLAV